jgi:hypothetical protein
MGHWQQQQQQRTSGNEIATGTAAFPATLAAPPAMQSLTCLGAVPRKIASSCRWGHAYCNCYLKYVWGVRGIGCGMWASWRPDSSRADGSRSMPRG